MIVDMFLSVFVDGFSNSELRDTLVMTYARLLVQAPKTVKAVSNTAIKWLAARLSGDGRVAATGSALVENSYEGISD
jgi:hypothetical protein